MKTTVLLLCGYKDFASIANENFLDMQIHRLKQLGFEPICVLSGGFADEFLRANPRLAECEIAFDTNDSPTLLTNIKAGLAATNGEGCFVLPLEIPAPEAALWNAIREIWRRIGFHTSTSILQVMENEEALWQRGFPLLITRKGNELIRKTKDLSSLTDSRLEYEHLEYTKEPDLATETNPL